MYLGDPWEGKTLSPRCRRTSPVSACFSSSSCSLYCDKVSAVCGKWNVDKMRDEKRDRSNRGAYVGNLAPRRGVLHGRERRITGMGWGKGKMERRRNEQIHKGGEERGRENNQQCPFRQKIKNKKQLVAGVGRGRGYDRNDFAVYSRIRAVNTYHRTLNIS